ncbi:hypothetical protein Javan623_0026 [Streptococcus phage Javan623]|nr:hypothetical protein AF66_02640 [Streptococcus uberis B190]QBX21973.1 hypothetical protein Javan623_0026 [Streptococcus phage Javan623]
MNEELGVFLVFWRTVRLNAICITNNGITRGNEINGKLQE